MSVDNGVQNKEEVNEEEVEFPQTWEALVEQNPILAGLPKPMPAESFSFDVAARFEETRTRMYVAFNASTRNEDDEHAAAMVHERVEALRGMIAWVKTVTDDEAKVDEFTRGMDVNTLFLTLLVVVKFVEDQLGKSVQSKSSSTSIR